MVASRLDDAVLFAPTLLRYEIASVCLKKLKLYPKRQGAILKALALLDEVDLREVEVVANEVVTLARRENLTAYDASYLWLARSLDLELVTLDKRLSRASK